MRIKITFRLSGKKQVLPLNYQYPVSAWIYKVLARGDAELALMLHEEGYRLENGKTFKLFTFSQLHFPARTFNIIPGTDRMELWSRNAWIIIAFQLPKPAEKFVLGLFRDQQVELGDRVSMVNMEVETVEMLAEPDLIGQEVTIRSLSPVVLAENKPDTRHETYLSPLDPAYERLFFGNLLDKYRLFSNTPDQMEALWETGKLTFKCLTKQPRQKLQVIKAHTSEEVRVRGYLFEYALTAPAALIQTGLNSGFGSMNALGFGCGEVVGVHTPNLT